MNDLEIVNKAKNKAIRRAEIAEKRIKELEQENKVLTQNLEDTEIINAELKSELSENKVADCHIVNGLCEQLTNAKELLKRYVPYRQITDSKAYKDLAEETEQFLNSEVEK